MAPRSHERGDLFDAVLAYLDEAGSAMETVYKLDEKGAFSKPDDPTARTLVYSRTGAGAAMLRDLIVRAWVQSSQTNTTSPSKNPLDPNAPGFDPTTGSAPAPVDFD